VVTARERDARCGGRCLEVLLEAEAVLRLLRGEDLDKVSRELGATGETLGQWKVWTRLRMKGVRTSKGRILRIMRENDLLAPSRIGARHGPGAHDGTIMTELPDMMWGEDGITTVTTEEGTATIFVAVDHRSADCVGIHAAKKGTRFEALEPFRQGMRGTSGGTARGSPVA